MTHLYNHELHKAYQLRLNTEINIRQLIFKAIEDKILMINDLTSYPDDQSSLADLLFPLATTHAFPNLQISDYVMCIDNYRNGGNLLTIRFLHPTEQYSEVLYLDPNDHGQIWLLIISPELKEIEEVKKYANVNLMNDTLESVINF